MELFIIIMLVIIPTIVMKLVDALARLNDFDGLEYLDDND